MKDAAGLSVLGLVVLYHGFFGFISSALVMIFKGFTKEGEPVFPPLLYAFLSSLFFFSVFIAGFILL